MDDKTFDDSFFRRLFWDWYDSLNTSEKEKFFNYPVDISEVFFYNKVYKNLYALSSIG